VKRLHGANRIERFRKTAELLKSEIVSYKGVSGIIFMGGLVRGFVDSYSDIDIVVLLSERDEDLRTKIRKIGWDEQERSGIEVDLEVHFLEDFERKKWNEMTRWDFSHAKIIFDPQGNIHKLFRERLKVTETFWKKRIVIYGEYVKWYCCSPEEKIGTLAGSWVDRGDLVSAHYCLDYAVHLLIKIVFVLNREFLPPPKWEMFYSHSLKWLPLNYEKLIGASLIVKSLSKRDLDRRLRAVRELWREILPKIMEETGLTPKLISRQYAKHVLGQG
jgi:predicted nucleotidyltransferase